MDKCRQYCGIYVVVGDTAFDTDGGSAYRLVKYLCTNGWYPILVPASYAIVNRIENEGIPIITIGGSRANSFTGHIYNVVKSKGISLPFNHDLPGCRSKHKNWSPLVPQCMVVYCIDAKELGYPIVFLFGDHAKDTSNAVDTFIGLIRNISSPYIKPNCTPNIFNKCDSKTCQPQLYCNDDPSVRC